MRMPRVQCTISVLYSASHWGNHYCNISCIWSTLVFLEHRSNYSFDIVTSMGMPASSIYMSQIICISPIYVNHINTKTKIHHAPAQEAPPLPRKSYNVRRPYDELLPSHIKGQSVNPKNYPTSSIWPTLCKDIYFITLIDPHTLVKA